MVSKYIYIKLVVFLFLVVVLSFVSCFFFIKQNYVFLPIALPLLVVQVVYLLRFLNSSNKKVAYFLNSLKNEDFTLSFSEETNSKLINELHASMNGLNKMIQKKHIENQTQEKYYQEILKQVNIGVLTFNKNGHILFVNSKTEKLFNHSPLNHIKQLKKIDEDLYFLLKNLNGVEKNSYQFNNEREVVQLSIKSSQVTLNNELLTLLAIQNINDELEEKETDSWMKLIRVLTHEIMNSITPIVSISESVLDYFKTENFKSEQLDENRLKKITKGVEVVKNQGTDLMRFVTSYRQFLSIPKPDKIIINVSEMLESIKVLLSKELETTTTQNIHIEKTEANFEIFADEQQLQQVLLNLTKNALQSIEKQTNGKVVLTAATGVEGKKYISISDNGPGISSEVKTQIFTPFFTTKQSGSGVGLSLSKQIMRLHGGTITVHSKPFEKTVFYVWF